MALTGPKICSDRLGTRLTRTLAQLHANACVGHVLQSSLVPRHIILLKAGTEAISEYRLLYSLSVFTVTLHVLKFE